MFRLTKQQLLEDLYTSFKIAARHKNSKPYVVHFRKHLEENLSELCEVLWNRTFQPQQSVCFIVNHPKKREVFAANFRDRIVHHLYFMYTHKIFERTFVHDTYSCIKKRGTHFGVDRLRYHIRSESLNYTRPCYILKMDIKGYFMNIDRELVAQIAKTSLHKMMAHRSDVEIDGKKLLWGDVVDIDFINYLTDTIALLDPTTNCRFRSDMSEWVGLSASKSLFKSGKGKGLPIGNLTSQLFSNVYLNKLDQFCKRDLGCKHYGRYVDDFYIVSADKDFLHSIVPKIEQFLREVLRLNINKGKTIITSATHGTEFLGMYIKRYGIYTSNQCLRRIKSKLYDYEYQYNLSRQSKTDVINSINSYLGIFRRTKSFNIRSRLFDDIESLKRYGYFNRDYTKFIPHDKETHKSICEYLSSQENQILSNQ